MTPFEIFRVPLNIYRKSAGSYVNGLWVEGSETTIPITASIQPASGEEMLSLPEGRRNRKTYCLFTSTKIELIRGSGNSTNPDQIQIYGERYEIIKVEPWQNNPAVFSITNHYRIIASALEAIA
jgi:hypothetical protein